ncbi:helix-turn-helix domain-containing protein [Acinetobacter baumannii]|uniref:helix-turn-helix domain-containing protein n=1 Tax=Acinetobacter baumannii TaxID=470 RepID=UPI003EDAE5DD
MVILMNNVQERTNVTAQGRSELINHIQQNLITLISSCRSVADMCRKIDVNRQQFNKYLAGQHIPSQKVLQKIARYFMIEAKDLLINPSVHDKFHRTLILSGFCFLKIAKISLNSSFFPKPIKR